MKLQERAITALQAINNNLPKLLEGPFLTTSSALKRWEYVGPLQEWPGYKDEVVQSCDEITNELTLWYVDGPPQESNDLAADEYMIETSFVNHEISLLGRIQALVFMVVNLVLQYHQHQVRFSDYGSAQKPPNPRGKPDHVLVNQAFQIKAVGDIKVWWIDVHQLGPCLVETAWLRHILAQPVDYMLEYQCKYGFITTDGTWGIEHSPLVLRSDRADVSTSGEAVLSTRQCFYHLACAVEQDGDVNNPTPRKDWIKEW
ncbi:hypothetical protein N7523_007537 [Penicillium sp. IBT 18751x]|nr:hypothetical protein N7523_007537 [Penicillium sp. IBT 18751x]